ncbi:MAG: hypothetical protein ACI814_004085, partial [Mariniblastus sp.]
KLTGVTPLLIIDAPQALTQIQDKANHTRAASRVEIQ